MPASALALRGLRPKRGKWPAPAKPLGIEGSFARDLRRLFDAADAIMLREITGDLELAAMTERLRGELGRTDAVEPEKTGEIEIDLLLDKLYQANVVVEREQPDEVLVDLLQRHGRAVNDHSLRQVRKQYKAALGVDVVGAAPHGPAILKHYVADNVSLIKKVRSEHFKRIEEVVSRHWRVGDRWETIADKLRSDLGVNANRAALIARDQVGKLNSEFSRDRHETLGVKEFIWRTSLDGRVRAQHRALEGKKFSYTKGGHPVEKLPGWAIRCRCYAEPVFEDESGEPEGPMGGPLEQDPFPENIGWARTSGGPGRRTPRPWSEPPRRPDVLAPPPLPKPKPRIVQPPAPQPEQEPAAVARARAEAEAAREAAEAAAETLRQSTEAARAPQRERAVTPYSATPEYGSDEMRDRIRSILGPDADEKIVNLLGVNPVHVKGAIRPSVGVHGSVWINADLNGGGVIVRKLAVKEGRITVTNELFEKGSLEEPGMGAKMLYRQVVLGRRYGVTSIETSAAGVGRKTFDPADQDAAYFNGYYTWPRLGYDGPLPAVWADEHRHELQRLVGKTDGVKISDLMRSAEGRQYWRDYGTFIDLEFDLSETSVGWRVLDAYVNAKGYRP